MDIRIREIAPSSLPETSSYHGLSTYQTDDIDLNWKTQVGIFDSLRDAGPLSTRLHIHHGFRPDSVKVNSHHPDSIYVGDSVRVEASNRPFLVAQPRLKYEWDYVGQSGSADFRFNEQIYRYNFFTATEPGTYEVYYTLTDSITGVHRTSPHKIIVVKPPEMKIVAPLDSAKFTFSAASIFVQPFDAVILHLEAEGELWDVYIFSDIGMNRLTTWVLRVNGGPFERQLLSITEYCGEDANGFKAPSGLTTNAIGRLFEPEYDVIYLADRGNDRIVEIGLEPDWESQECHLFCIRSFGEEVLEWPVDVAISAYGGRAEADFYVVDWGHEKDTGELVRLDSEGNFEYKNGFACHNVTGDSIVGLFRPMSVACYPDTTDGSNLIFVSETIDGSITVLISNPDDPFVMWHVVSLEAGRFLDIGGVAIDGSGRIFVVNRGAQFIQAFGPDFCEHYPHIGGPGERNVYFNYPANLIIDTYHGFYEALLIESYNRQSGLRTFSIGGDQETSRREGGFRRSKAVVGHARHAVPQLPLVSALHDAYPNPFNSKCKIAFALAAESPVVIEVYDALGRKVTRLLDKTMPAGSHSITFNARGLSSGTYFYKMTAGNFTRTKQVVLVK